MSRLECCEVVEQNASGRMAWLEPRGVRVLRNDVQLGAAEEEAENKKKQLSNASLSQPCGPSVGRDATA